MRKPMEEWTNLLTDIAMATFVWIKEDWRTEWTQIANEVA